MLESLRVYRIGTKMNLFDPASYAEVRRPLREAQTLPPVCYFSPEFYQREVSEIFLKKWNLVGRVDYLPHAGDFMARELVGVQFIVIRGDDGVLRAFSNTCRHRGAQLLEGEGNCQRIVCPYHSWAYSNEGRLSHANGMEEAENFDKTTHGLIEIKLDTWAGFIFVNFDERASDLAGYIGDLDRYTHSYHLEGYGHGQAPGVGNSHQLENLCRKLDGGISPRHGAQRFGLQGDHQRHFGGRRPGSLCAGAVRRGRGYPRGVTGRHRFSTDIDSRRRGPRWGLIIFCSIPAPCSVCDVDSMWFKQMVPEGPDQVRNIVAICFSQGNGGA